MSRLKMSLMLAALATFVAVQFTAAETEPAVDPQIQARLAQVKVELHNLQLAVERFGVDHRVSDEGYGTSRYPHSLSQLVVATDGHERYIAPGFYHNPFAPGADGGLNATQVPFGWTEQAVGNFSYLTQHNDAGEVVAYVLVGYGPATGTGTFSITADEQPDGIIVTMTSGSVDHQTPQVCYDNGRLVEIDWRVAE